MIPLAVESSQVTRKSGQSKLPKRAVWQSNKANVALPLRLSTHLRFALASHVAAQGAR